MVWMPWIILLSIHLFIFEVYVRSMSSFFEYLTKEGSVISTIIVLLGVAVIVASSAVLGGYYQNFILMIIGIFAGVVIIIIGGKYGKFKKIEQKNE